jgi:hypothetical protein
MFSRGLLQPISKRPLATLAKHGKRYFGGLPRVKFFTQPRNAASIFSALLITTKKGGARIVAAIDSEPHAIET